jgi:tRNA pseudouridine38-40 synthase
MKNRYFIEIAYDGMKFNGWQIQKNATSVQETLEKALSIVLREPISIVGAGRTDTGVHATGQFAHFDTENPLNQNFIHQINGVLPYSIAIMNVYNSPNRLHARFDALSRRYLYRITKKKNPFEKERALFLPISLDLEKMKIAATELLKYENFASFCKAHGDNKTYLCDIQFVEWKESKYILEFHIQANRFLRGMVRAIVGTLLEVGKGKLNVQDFIEIIQSENRKNARMNVVPYGLYLTHVIYPENSLIKINV